MKSIGWITAAGIALLWAVSPTAIAQEAKPAKKAGVVAPADGKETPPVQGQENQTKTKRGKRIGPWARKGQGGPQDKNGHG